MVERSHKGLVQRDVKVKRGGKTFTQKRWVKDGEDKPDPKKGKKEDPKSKGSFKIGNNISFMGRDLTIEKVSESEKTVKLSDGKVYTFDAIDKGSKIKKDKDNKIDLNTIISGELPDYKSMPKNISIPKDQIKKMDKIIKQSKKLEREIGSSISFSDGKMDIGEVSIGSGMNCTIKGGSENYAIYHTHPKAEGIKPLDTLSLEDIMLVTTRHRLQRTNIMMAHTTENNNLWVCVPSSETMDEIDSGMFDIMGTQKFVTKIQNKMDEAIITHNDKMAQKAIKEYCDKFKMKLYVGKPDNLKVF